MGKYYALRKYPSGFRCSSCSSQTLNPTLTFQSRSGGRAHCNACGGWAICPLCYQTVSPTKPASNRGSVSVHGYVFDLYNGECSASCPGLPPGVTTITYPMNVATAAVRPVPMVAVLPAPLAHQKAGPFMVPSAPNNALDPVPVDPEKRAKLRIKLMERISQAIHIQIAQGHDVPHVVVFDVEARPRALRQKCATCGSFADIFLGEFDDPAYLGTSISFECKKLKTKKG